MGTLTATCNFSASMKPIITNTLSADDAAPSVQIGDSWTINYTSGTTANKIDRAWSDKGRTLSDTSTVDLDLYDLGTVDIGAGAGLDPLGQSVTFADIVGIAVYNQDGSAGNCLVGNNGTAAAFNSIFGGDDESVTVKPGGLFLLTAPTEPAYAVTDTSNHLLRFTASGGDITYDVHIIGRDA